MVYVTAAITAATMLLLQFGILTFNNTREAKSTTNAYVSQTKSVIEANKREEEVLLASLKDDYIILSKAVAYYLDNYPSATYDDAELRKICSLMSIDEIHIFDENGVIISSTNTDYIGMSFSSGEQISYFTPMLYDKTLSMCQDVTPNTAENKPMMYAMTWNESGTQMVQIGVEPVRFIKQLKEHDIQETVKKIAIDNDASVIVAKADTLEVVGSKNEALLTKNLSEVTSLNKDSAKEGFLYWTTLSGKVGNHFCNIGFTEDYCICIFLSHNTFLDRTLQSLLIVGAYLLLASFVIIIIFKRLFSSREQNTQHLQVFQSMSEIYYSLHLLDLKNNTAMEYSSRNQVKDAFGGPESKKADSTMIGIMKATMSDEYLERGLAFTDITTLAERMRGKKIISMELLGKNVGWIRMSFVTFEEENGVPTKVIIATQIIDEEKKAAESLYLKSHVDELSGCFNRRAYNVDTLELDERKEGKEFIYISFDVNGLKTINDTLGHEAGDELIFGAAECMKKVFSKHGKIYRTGGDEFVGIIEADEPTMQELCAAFDEEIANWNGNFVKGISVSYGYVSSSDAKGLSVLEITALADKKMYESKSEYYKKKGIDRRRT